MIQYPPLPPKAWYERNLSIILALILFFPLGLLLMWRYATWNRTAKWIVTGFFVLVVAVGSTTSGQSNSQQTAPASPTQQSKAQPTPTPTPQTTHYPPTTLADLQSLAAKGDASAVHEFYSESTGLTECPQPKREVTVDPSLTGQQLTSDLLAYFYAQHLDSPCGSIVFAYHDQGEAGDAAYTAGRINVDVTDASGTANTDPNAGNLKHKLTLDVGDMASGQESIVTY